MWRVPLPPWYHILKSMQSSLLVPCLPVCPFLERNQDIKRTPPPPTVKSVTALISFSLSKLDLEYSANGKDSLCCWENCLPTAGMPSPHWDLYCSSGGDSNKAHRFPAGNLVKPWVERKTQARSYWWNACTEKNCHFVLFKSNKLCCPCCCPCHFLSIFLFCQYVGRSFCLLKLQDCK